jgi:ribosomal protein S6--L-glutamate ligase
MKFVLIEGCRSRKKTSAYFIRAAKKHFDTVFTVPLDKLRLEFENGKSRLMYKNTNLLEYDVCLPRFFAGDGIFAEAVLQELEESSVYIPSTTDSFRISNNKYYTMQMLADLGMKVPNSALSISQEPAKKMAARLGFPLTFKLISGFGGKGIIVVQSEEDMIPLADTFTVFKEFICLQEFLENEGWDIRCNVIGDDAFGIKRVAKKGEWRTNVSRGATAVKISLPGEVKDAGLKAARILGLDLCGIDFIKSKDNYWIVEANITPGVMPDFFRGELADKFINFLYKRTKKYKITGS